MGASLPPKSRFAPPASYWFVSAFESPLAPAVIVALRIEEQPVLPRPAVLVMRWSLPGLPVLGGLLGPVLPFLRMGPPWLTLKGERIRVDIARALEERGAAELLDRVASLQVTTRLGAIVVRFVLHVHG